MARGGGAIQAGGIYHVISRFVAREWFIESAAERRRYLALLGAALLACDWRCFSFAIMSSHIHLGLRAGAAPLAAWLRPMHTAFASWLNDRRARIGGVFVKGPNVLAVGDDDVARLIAYHHHNPVRAGVVAAPGDSDWTSYRAYLDPGPPPPWLDVVLGRVLARRARAGAPGTSGDELRAWAEEPPPTREELIARGLLPRPRAGRPPARPDGVTHVARAEKVETRLSAGFGS